MQYVEVVSPQTQTQQVWVTARVYAAIHSLSIQTLANQRYRDLLAGRDHALPGYPEYRRFGRSVRYRLLSEPENQEAK